MDNLLILRNVRIENANAVAGLTWGFPAISNFLGFVHALSRKLPPELEMALTGCGVICHHRQVHAFQPGGWGDFVFAQTRNPLTQKGESPSFVEEGRMHLTISLVISVNGLLEDPEEFGDLIEPLVLAQRLAGGSITEVDRVDVFRLPDNRKERAVFEKRQLKRLLPGFALVQRADVLAEHTYRLLEQDSSAEKLDAWLDFSALKFQAEAPDNETEQQSTVQWNVVHKPAGGWLVPIAVGYRGISELYSPGEVAKARDGVTPFRFVESVYTVGEWISPHRVEHIEDIIWRYDVNPETGWYACINNYQAQKQN